MSDELKEALKESVRSALETLAHETLNHAVQELLKRRLLFGDDWIAFKHLQPVERLTGKLQR